MRAFRGSMGDRVFLAVNTVLISLVTLIILYPLVYIVSSSFSSPDAVVTGRVLLWPVDLSLEGFRAVFRSPMIMSGYANTLIYMIVGTALNVTLTLLAAYPLSRRDFKARNLLMMFLVITMYFNGGMVPTYLIVKQLGLLNTRAAMILPGALSVWNVIITRTYFQNDIPKELLEAAQIDGCSNRAFFVRCVLPLSQAIIAINVLFYGVGHWNSFMNALLYLHDSSKYPLQIVLRDILIRNVTDTAVTESIEVLEYRSRIQALLKYALIVVASAPVMIAYPFVQKFFVRGIMIGSLKG